MACRNISYDLFRQQSRPTCQLVACRNLSFFLRRIPAAQFSLRVDECLNPDRAIQSDRPFWLPQLDCDIADNRRRIFRMSQEVLRVVWLRVWIVEMATGLRKTILLLIARVVDRPSPIRWDFAAVRTLIEQQSHVLRNMFGPRTSRLFLLSELKALWRPRKSAAKSSCSCPRRRDRAAPGVLGVSVR